MENASKALIIAGAILLSILLISLGLMVYNQAKDTIGAVNLSQQEIEAFNSKFTSYEGTNVSGSQVNALIQTVMSTNQQAISDSTGAYVAIRFPSVIATTGGRVARVVIGVSSDEKIGYCVYAYDQVSDMNSFWSHYTEKLAKNKLDGSGGAANVLASSTAKTVNVGDTEETIIPLKVNAGTKYDVELKYVDGLVAGIFVK